MAVARMHKQRKVMRGYNKPRYTKQRGIKRGGVVPPPAATLTTVAPTTGVAAGNTAVTLTGTGFTGATGATFGGSAGTTFVVVSATSITVRTPAHAVGAVTVVVLSPNGNATKTTGFTYT